MDDEELVKFSCAGTDVEASSDKENIRIDLNRMSPSFVSNA
jgi:hypothetical protein